MRLALKHKKDLATLIQACPDVTLRQGLASLQRVIGKQNEYLAAHPDTITVVSNSRTEWPLKGQTE